MWFLKDHKSGQGANTWIILSVNSSVFYSFYVAITSDLKFEILAAITLPGRKLDFGQFSADRITHFAKEQMLARTWC